jgi:hypothetical protein
MINTWEDMIKVVGSMGERELADAINYEVATYCRASIIKRMHSRFAKLRTARERQSLLKGEILL